MAVTRKNAILSVDRSRKCLSCSEMMIGNSRRIYDSFARKIELLSGRRWLSKAWGRQHFRTKRQDVG